jgi:hypothetical protein
MIGGDFAQSVASGSGQNISAIDNAFALIDEYMDAPRLSLRW